MFNSKKKRKTTSKSSRTKKKVATKQKTSAKQNLVAIGLEKNQQKTIIYKNFGNSKPFPDKYICWLQYLNDGYFAAGNNARGQGATVQINYPVYPMKGATLWGNPQQAIASTDCSNLAQLLNNSLYQSMKVLKHVAMFKLMPGSLADQLKLAVAPWNTATPIPGGTITYEQIANMPFSREKVFNAVNDNSSLTITVNPAEVVGVTNQQYFDDVSGQYSCTGTTAPIQNVVWQYALYNSNNATYAAAVGWEIKLFYQVQFYNLSVEINQA
jgi:hypothetical protein